MNIYKLEKDIRVLCQTVETFPRGIKEAFEKIIGEFPATPRRENYGISWMDDKGKIVYRVAIEQFSNEEADQKGLDSFTIIKGDYIIEPIVDWMAKLGSIPAAFSKLLSDPRMDKNFPCVEWYKNDKEMMCMVKIIS